ncbi:hypothetical protein BCR43DRAFT_492787 [Syncephalastrum racemosum]|uniref:Uncharacterized protein n=1 Tax=Syncephalastrum racemosum TaxID=13706 RepID=A0A1X2HAT5_SYNRA|nr:hypothetical protein BCR43DRAFT_492787 [Syncephalastrum racemosum]
MSATSSTEPFPPKRLTPLVSTLPPGAIIFRPPSQEEADRSFHTFLQRQQSPPAPLASPREKIHAVITIDAPGSDCEEDEYKPWWIFDSEDGLYSMGAVLFLFGFVFPPLWWIGAVWPRRPGERGGKMAERWQSLCRVMSIGFSILLIAAVIVTAVLWAR